MNYLSFSDKSSLADNRAPRKECNEANLAICLCMEKKKYLIIRTLNPPDG